MSVARAVMTAMAAHPAGKARRCNHKPGTVVEVDGECLWSTCRTCSTPIWRLFESGSEDSGRRMGWGGWRTAPIPMP